MEFDLAQLRALDATVAAGTLEGAARLLHVTPSAVSQRLKALEVATGRVLLVRSKPVRCTDSGEVVLRLARQVALLAADTAHELRSSEDLTLPLAVNADSLATWVLDALAPLAGGIRFAIHREDQDRTAALLREGAVVAAVTSQAEPVPGCRSTRLGGMRYRPMAAPAVAGRWFATGTGTGAAAWAAAPVVVFDRDDDLQHRHLRRHGIHHDPPVHLVPSSADYLSAVRLGFGWGMLPDLQSAALERAGEVVCLDPGGAVDVELHWQQWRLRSAALDRVTDAVLTAARTHLLP